MRVLLSTCRRQLILFLLLHGAFYYTPFFSFCIALFLIFCCSFKMFHVEHFSSGLGKPLVEQGRKQGDPGEGKGNLP